MSSSQAAHEKAVRPSRWSSIFAILFSSLVAFLDGADTQAMAIAAPLVAKDLAIGPAGLGLIFSCGLLGAAIGALGCGSLADKYGAKRMLVICTFWFGMFQLATAYSDSFASLLLFRSLAGIGLGGAAPCFLSLAASQVAPQYRARLLGLIWALFPLGGFAGGFVNGWIVTHHGWQMVFIVGGVLPIATAALQMVLVRGGSGVPRAHKPAAPTPSSSGFLAALSASRDLRRQTLLLWCVYFGAFGTLAGLVVWIPSMVVEIGFAPAQGAAILSWHALGALVSMASAGFVLERIGPKALTIGLGVATALLVILGGALSLFAAVALCMMLLGVFLGLAASGAVAFAANIFPPEIQASGLGWAMGMGRIGQVVLPFLMGQGLALGFGGYVVLMASAILPCISCFAAAKLAKR